MTQEYFYDYDSDDEDIEIANEECFEDYLKWELERRKSRLEVIREVLRLDFLIQSHTVLNPLLNILGNLTVAS